MNQLAASVWPTTSSNRVVRRSQAAVRQRRRPPRASLPAVLGMAVISIISVIDTATLQRRAGGPWRRHVGFRQQRLQAAIAQLGGVRRHVVRYAPQYVRLPLGGRLLADPLQPGQQPTQGYLSDRCAHVDPDLQLMTLSTSLPGASC